MEEERDRCILMREERRNSERRRKGLGKGGREGIHP